MAVVAMLVGVGCVQTSLIYPQEFDFPLRVTPKAPVLVAVQGQRPYALKWQLGPGDSPCRIQYARYAHRGSRGQAFPFRARQGMTSHAVLPGVIVRVVNGQATTEPSMMPAISALARMRHTEAVMTKNKPRLARSLPTDDELESLVSSWAGQLHAREITPESLNDLVSDVLADAPPPAATGRGEQMLAEAIQSAFAGSARRLEDHIRILVLYHGVEEARLLISAKVADPDGSMR